MLSPENVWESVRLVSLKRDFGPGFGGVLALPRDWRRGTSTPASAQERIWYARVDGGQLGGMGGGRARPWG